MSGKKKDVDYFDLRKFLKYGDIQKIENNTGYDRNYIRKLLIAGNFDHAIRKAAYLIIQENKEQLEEALATINELTKKNSSKGLTTSVKRDKKKILK